MLLIIKIYFLTSRLGPDLCGSAGLNRGNVGNLGNRRWFLRGGEIGVNASK